MMETDRIRSDEWCNVIVKELKEEPMDNLQRCVIPKVLRKPKEEPADTYEVFVIPKKIGSTAICPGIRVYPTANPPCPASGSLRQSVAAFSANESVASTTTANHSANLFDVLTPCFIGVSHEPTSSIQHVGRDAVSKQLNDNAYFQKSTTFCDNDLIQKNHVASDSIQTDDHSETESIGFDVDDLDDHQTLIPPPLPPLPCNSEISSIPPPPSEATDECSLLACFMPPLPKEEFPPPPPPGLAEDINVAAAESVKFDSSVSVVVNDEVVKDLEDWALDAPLETENPLESDSAKPVDDLDLDIVREAEEIAASAIQETENAHRTDDRGPPLKKQKWEANQECAEELQLWQSDRWPWEIPEENVMPLQPPCFSIVTTESVQHFPVLRNPNFPSAFGDVNMNIVNRDNLEPPQLQMSRKQKKAAAVLTAACSRAANSPKKLQRHAQAQGRGKKKPCKGNCSLKNKVESLEALLAEADATNKNLALNEALVVNSLNELQQKYNKLRKRYSKSKNKLTDFRKRYVALEKLRNGELFAEKEKLRNGELFAEKEKLRNGELFAEKEKLKNGELFAEKEAQWLSKQLEYETSVRAAQICVEHSSKLVAVHAKNVVELQLTVNALRSDNEKKDVEINALKLSIKLLSTQKQEKVESPTSTTFPDMEACFQARELWETLKARVNFLEMMNKQKDEQLLREREYSAQLKQQFSKCQIPVNGVENKRATAENGISSRDSKQKSENLLCEPVTLPETISKTCLTNQFGADQRVFDELRAALNIKALQLEISKQDWDPTVTLQMIANGIKNCSIAYRTSLTGNDHVPYVVVATVNNHETAKVFGQGIVLLRKCAGLQTIVNLQDPNSRLLDHVSTCGFVPLVPAHEFERAHHIAIVHDVNKRNSSLNHLSVENLFRQFLAFRATLNGCLPVVEESCKSFLLNNEKCVVECTLRVDNDSVSVRHYADSAKARLRAIQTLLAKLHPLAKFWGHLAHIYFGVASDATPSIAMNANNERQVVYSKFAIDLMPECVSPLLKRPAVFSPAMVARMMEFREKLPQKLDKIDAKIERILKDEVDSLISPVL